MGDRDVDRRNLLRGAMLLGTSAVAGAALVGCSNDASEAAASAPATSVRAAPRILLAYFSRAGENYYYGGRRDLVVGNTRRVVNKISRLVPIDVYEIEARDPYADGYDATVARNVREQHADARPAIANPLPDIRRYDTVLLGSGIWNVRPPMIMSTFLGDLDLDGKSLYPFVAYAVSGRGNTMRVYADLAPTATIGRGLAVLGETSKSSGPQVRAWLGEIGLLP